MTTGGIDVVLSPDEGRFRDEARGWLAANVPRSPLRPFDTAEGFAEHRSWERQLVEAGRGVVGWPVEYGGRGASRPAALLFEDEYTLAGGR